MKERVSLIGRDRELAYLDRLLAAAAAGEGAVVLVAGEAGVGKTALAEAAIAAAGLTVLRGGGGPPALTPYAPVAGALRDFLRRAPDGFDRLGPAGTHLGTLLPELGWGDAAAREVLIERFLPAIEALARDYAVEGLERADLIQEGCVGLLRALARFDPEFGTPFWAYASWWVRQALQNARSDFIRPFRLPPRALAQLSRLKSAHAAFYARERREPTTSELATEAQLPLEQVEMVMRTDARPTSVEEPVEGLRAKSGFWATSSPIPSPPTTTTRSCRRWPARNCERSCPTSRSANEASSRRARASTASRSGWSTSAGGSGSARNASARSRSAPA